MISTISIELGPETLTILRMLAERLIGSRQGDIFAPLPADEPEPVPEPEPEAEQPGSTYQGGYYVPQTAEEPDKAEPEPAEDQQAAMEELKTLVRSALRDGKHETVKALLTEFGAAKISALPLESCQAFAEALRARL